MTVGEFFRCLVWSSIGRDAPAIEPMDFRGEAGFLSDSSGNPKPVHREFGLDGYRHTPQREKDLALMSCPERSPKAYR